MEPVDEKPYEKASRQIDRVVIGKEENDTVEKWVEELNARAEGLVRFTKAEVVNFLIRSHPSRLSVEKQQALAIACYDETRWLGWAMERMRAAKKRGSPVSFDELTKFRDDLLGSRKTRKKTAGENQHTDAATVKED